jgi:homoserine dehydrogenase
VEAVVTGVELIAAALAAGAGAGVKDTAKAVVADAYAALKGLLHRRLAGRPGAQLSAAREN